MFEIGQYRLRLRIQQDVGRVGRKRPVHRDAEYCWSKAAQYEREAKLATDKIMRAFFYRMSDQWRIAAQGFESIEEDH